MSFDLGVWYEPGPVTARHAADVYDRLAKGEDDVVAADKRNLAFHAELIARFPRLETLSDEDLGASPWSVSPDANDRRVILSMGWGRAADTARAVLELAERHQLVCFDPQTGRVHNLPRRGPGDRLEFPDGSVVENPGPERLRALLAAIDETNWFACLDRDEGRFAQVALGHLDQVPSGMFTFEYREGPGRHFGTEPISRAEAVNLVLAYAAGALEALRDRHTWHAVGS